MRKLIFVLLTCCSTLSIKAQTAAGSSGEVQYNSSGSLGASAELFWDNTNSRLSVGTSSPSLASKFYVHDNSTYSGATYPPLAAFFAPNSSSTGGVAFLVGKDATHNFSVTFNNADNSTAFKSNGTEALRILSTGNVGIGTTTPAYNLDVNGTFRTTADGVINGLTVGKGGSNVSDNTVLGVQAGNSNTTGYGSTYIGYQAGFSNTSAVYNTFIGKQTGYSNITGYANIFIGVGAGYYNTTGSQNVFIGGGANNTSGNENTFLGYGSGNSNTGGTYNTAIGSLALRFNTTGIYNTVLGASALTSNTTGGHNIAMGYAALQSNITGNYNTGIGDGALQASSADHNTSLGYSALASTTTGGANTANGSLSLFANTTGLYNVAMGVTSGYNTTTGSFNTIIGTEAGYDQTTASSNTLIGYRTGRGLTTGGNNTIVGANVTGLTGSLSNNIIIADGQGNRRINVDENGKVGIGTTTPAEALDVVGNVKFSGAFMPAGSAGTAGQILQSNGTGTAPTWVNGGPSTAWTLAGNASTTPSTNFIGTTDNVGLSIRTNNTERIALDNNGAVAFKTPLAATDGTIFSINGGTTYSGVLTNLFEENSSGAWKFKTSNGGDILSFNNTSLVLSSGPAIDVDFSNAGQVIANNVTAVRLRGLAWPQTNIAVNSPAITYTAVGSTYVPTGAAAHVFTVLGPLTNTATNIATFDNGAQPLVSITKEGKMLIGTTDVSQAGTHLLAVNGSAIFTKAVVKLNANWPDYVFKPAYQLPALSEVEAYLKKHQHLPDMPAATEVEKNGVDIGDTQTLLVKKVEELTLYMIDLNKKVETLLKENEELKKKINAAQK